MNGDDDESIALLHLAALQWNARSVFLFQFELDGWTWQRKWSRVVEPNDLRTAYPGIHGAVAHAKPQIVNAVGKRTRPHQQRFLAGGSAPAIRIGELIDLEPSRISAPGLGASAEILECSRWLYRVGRYRRRRLVGQPGQRIDLVVSALRAHQNGAVWPSRGVGDLHQILHSRGHVEDAHEPYHAPKRVVANSSSRIWWRHVEVGNAGSAAVAQGIDLGNGNGSDPGNQWIGRTNLVTVFLAALSAEDNAELIAVWLQFGPFKFLVPGVDITRADYVAHSLAEGRVA